MIKEVLTEQKYFLVKQTNDWLQLKKGKLIKHFPDTGARDLENNLIYIRLTMDIGQILGISAYIFMISMNIFNGVEIKYPLRVTPFGFAFSIWGIIFIGLAICQFLMLPNLYGILAMILTGLWLPIFSKSKDDPVYLVYGAIDLLLVAIFSHFYWKSAKSLLTKLFTGLFAGWITVATLLNCMIVLKYTFKIENADLWFAPFFYLAGGYIAYNTYTTEEVGWTKVIAMLWGLVLSFGNFTTTIV